MEKLSINLGNHFELRPWPKSYHFESEEYPYNNIHYFGIRIKRSPTGKLPPESIDITETLKFFYNKINERVENDDKLYEFVHQKIVDIKVNYMKRENLPDDVRPKEV